MASGIQGIIYSPLRAISQQLRYYGYLVGKTFTPTGAGHITVGARNNYSSRSVS